MLLGRLAELSAAGLCSLAQARPIAQRTGSLVCGDGFEVARAGGFCATLRYGNWRPWALCATPEWNAAHRAESGLRTGHDGGWPSASSPAPPDLGAVPPTLCAWSRC